MRSPGPSWCSLSPFSGIPRNAAVAFPVFSPSCIGVMRVGAGWARGAWKCANTLTIPLEKTKVSVAACAVSLLDVQIDLRHKAPVQHSAELFITRCFHPSWQSTFLHRGAGEARSCVLQSCFDFCCVALPTNCTRCCYSWFMENAVEENCCNDRKPLGNGSYDSFLWEFSGIFKGVWVLHGLKAFWGESFAVINLEAGIWAETAAILFVIQQFW